MRSPCAMEEVVAATRSSLKQMGCVALKVARVHSQRARGILRTSVAARWLPITLAVGLAVVPTSSIYAQAEPTPETEKPRQASVNRAMLDALPTSSSEAGTDVDKTRSGASSSSGNLNNPEIPPAVEKQLQIMQERIEQLERQLKASGEAGTPSTAAARGLSTPNESAVAPPAPNPETVAARPQDNSKSAEPASGTATVKKEGAMVPTSSESTASQASETPAVDTQTPFAYADWTWLNGTARNKDAVWDSQFFTPEIRFDTHFIQSFNKPRDNTLGGSTEIFRSGEVQIEQISFGGDFHWQNVRGRVLTLGGMFGVTTPRNDASVGRGQWDLRGAYRYFSEAYGGYHFNVNHGLNIDAGLFVFYIGLFSYYNFDNWAYQPSFVSSNTPWFFNGLRIQWFPTNKLKIEPWIINGWQSYGKFGTRPGLGGQIIYRLKPWVALVFNNYGMGEDTLSTIHPGAGRSRIHTDDSIEVKYYDRPTKFLDKMAFSFTGDLGCEYGGGVSCHKNKPLVTLPDGSVRGGPKQSFAGWMLYNRFWFKHDTHGITVGGGVLDNPGRYLVLLSPINGADAVSGSPYFPAAPGLPFKGWDASITYDWMPKQYITFRWEYGYRHASVPYWSGADGITPPGGNNGSPAQFVCLDNTPGPTGAGCGSHGGLWTPDLRKDEPSIRMAIMVKF